ncbi:MAG TPA: DUF2158 domain-containing protein [Planctomycetota bacterium]|nr:DUF2158 domain-containing protein [Planctomycetota bacterium]
MAVFKEGDLVQLKSGGPKMTVVLDQGGGTLICKWFVGGKLNSGQFSADSLVPWVEPPQAKAKK